ncbi:P-loop containing nucleoside triphosphate hydrolase protein [Mycena metata]|uniref:P-loop containing nucleoside triphosphate hydrolase protein n=1 Tax=Mycena metata TaxID=1033252 RepID=A0AAD7IT77_9AGAR|nr:P-loop containing nucleoside triphosphate hydrolase protein [Mycena metata]
MFHSAQYTLKLIIKGFAVAPVVQRINNCPSPSRIFQGRHIVLKRMHQFFGTNPGRQLIYVLHGLGGVGKTQIALKFIQEFSVNVSDILLVDASTLDTIDTALKNIAVSKGVGDSAQDALNCLQSKHKGWLLFFDNADDRKINVNEFFPHCDHGSIIITTRNPGLKVYGEHSPVSDMEETDAIALLLRSAAKESSEENIQTAAKIVKELYYLPLAIAQAGAFISKSEDLNSYLALYAENRARLLREKPEQSHDQYAWTVYTTWQISFDQLSKPAAMLLQLCSFLHYTGISEDIFRNASNSLNFLDVTNEIKAYSLISFDAATKMFSIHPLVHGWSQSTLVDEGSSRLCIRSILGMSISEIPDHDVVLPSLRLMPHVGLAMPFNANVGADFRAAFWGIYLGAGKLKEAQKLIEQTFEKYRLVFGEGHLATLEAMHRLAVTYRYLGEYKKAEQLEVTVVEKRTKLLGEDDPETLSAMGTLATTYSKLGDFTKAKELEVTVLEKRTTLLGEDHPKTLNTMGNLGTTYSKLGDFAKAKELEATVLEKRTKFLGEDHPETLRAMVNLATTYSGLGDLAKAKELKLTVLEKRIKFLGEDHPETLSTMGKLATTYSKLGDFTKAKELEVTVLEKRTTLLGEDHPKTLNTMENLATTYSKLGDFAQAKELEITVLKKRTTLLLAVSYYDQGEFTRAEELQIVVLKKQR